MRVRPPVTGRQPGRAAEAGDVQPIVDLYAPGATFSSHPFRNAEQGRQGVRGYVESVFASESEVRARFGEPIVDGRRAAVSWWAELREEGETITLAGTSVLTFDDAGLVVDQWDTWDRADGRRPPPADPRFALDDS